MIRTLTVLLSALALLAGVACAADIDGKWKADYTTPDGSARSSTFTFKADGDKLTGNVTGQSGEVAIQDGKVAGDSITFFVMRNFGGNEVKLSYKGKLAGGEIKFTISFGDQGEFEITAKKLAS